MSAEGKCRRPEHTTKRNVRQVHNEYPTPAFTCSLFLALHTLLQPEATHAKPAMHCAATGVTIEGWFQGNAASQQSNTV